MTEKQQATNAATLTHVLAVQHQLNKIIQHLMHRGEVHDASKLTSPEVEVFAEFGSKLAKLTYGSPEYEENLKAMGPALEHHYASKGNMHHPEHWEGGVNDMTLVDVVEMFCDWCAAAERQHNGNILKTLEVVGQKYAIDPQLLAILKNTAKMLEEQN